MGKYFLGFTRSLLGICWIFPLTDDHLSYKTFCILPFKNPCHKCRPCPFCLADYNRLHAVSPHQAQKRVQAAEHNRDALCPELVRNLAVMALASLQRCRQDHIHIKSYILHNLIPDGNIKIIRRNCCWLWYAGEEWLDRAQAPKSTSHCSISCPSG